MCRQVHSHTATQATATCLYPNAASIRQPPKLQGSGSTSDTEVYSWAAEGPPGLSVPVAAIVIAVARVPISIARSILVAVIDPYAVARASMIVPAAAVIIAAAPMIVTAPMAVFLDDY